MRLAQSPLLWGSEGFSKDFKESSESKGAHPSHSQKARTGQSIKCPPPRAPRGTEGSNPSPSRGESGANSSQVDEVLERFRTFEELGYTDVLVRHLSNDQPKVLGSLERLAAVRAALA